MSQQQPARGFSFEFFPPKTDAGRTRLSKTLQKLAPLRPSFVSVTFGAGGSTRDGSFQTASEIIRTTDLDVTPHLSCIGSAREQIAAQLETYRAIGVRRVLAVRGDIPRANHRCNRRSPTPTSWSRSSATLAASTSRSAATRSFIRRLPVRTPTSITSYARPAGADEAITQYFYTNDAYFRFVEWVRRLGVEIPIVPGLMPLTDFTQVSRFSQFCGADIPAWIRKRMQALEGDARGQEELGIELATRQAEALLRNGAPGIHFYTLNRAEATLRVWNNLGLAPAESAARDQPSAN